MGFTSDITNRIDGKKYLISTAGDKKDGGWQTAVLKYKLFGIPDLLHPAMFIEAPDEEHARQVHSRVEKIVSELPSNEWEAAKWELFKQIMDKAFPDPDVSTHETSRSTGMGGWPDFRGVSNTEEVLCEKARAITLLIEMDWETGITLAAGFKENPEYSEVRLGEGQARRVRAEAVAVLLRMVDETAFAFLDSEKRATLMAELVACVTDMLANKGGLPASEFTELLCERYAEYAHFRKWVADVNEAQKNTLLGEYANKIGAIVNIERHAAFNAMLINLHLRSFERWELKELLLG